MARYGAQESAGKVHGLVVGEERRRFLGIVAAVIVHLGSGGVCMAHIPLHAF